MYLLFLQISQNKLKFKKKKKTDTRKNMTHALTAYHSPVSEVAARSHSD